MAAAETAVEQATAALAVLQKAAKSGASGTFWWMERELEEAKKYMPKCKFASFQKKMKKKQAKLKE